MGIEIVNGKFSTSASKDSLRVKNGVGSNFRTFRSAVPKVVEHTLSTGGTTSTITAMIPDGAIVRGYGLTVLETITTGGDRTTINIGHAAGNTQYGTRALTTQALAAGTKVTFADGASAITVPYNAPQDLVIQVSGGTSGNITAGKVRVEIWYDITE